jgi:hypothetical protein
MARARFRAGQAIAGVWEPPAAELEMFNAGASVVRVSAASPS